jgi:tetratricopeptide (TPR) repeat protein
MARVVQRLQELTWQAWLELVISGACVLASVLIVISAVRKGMTKYYLEKALFYIDSNQHARVTDSLRSAIDWDPGYLDSRLLMAKLLVELGDLDEAQSIYEQIPGDLAKIGLAKLWIKKADREPSDIKAETCISRAIEIIGELYPEGPFFHEAKLVKGHAKLFEAVRLGRSLDPAISTFEAINPARPLLSLGGMLDYYSGMGLLAYLKGDYKTCCAMFRKITICAPQTEGAWLNWVYAKVKRYLTPLPLSVLQEERPQYTLVLRTMERKMEDSAPIKMAYMRFSHAITLAYLKGGDIKTALRLQKGLKRKLPDLLEPALLYLKLLLEGAGKHQEILHEIQNIINILEERQDSGPLMVTMLNELAVVKAQIAEGRPRYIKEGIAHLRKAIQLEPEDYALNRNLAVLLLRIGGRREALKVFERVKRYAQSSKEERVKRDILILKGLFEE